MPVLEVSGPLTVKEVENLVFVAARSNPQFEASQRTWLEADRSYFIRWREKRPAAPLRVIGLVHVFQLPEMASRITVIPFDEQPTPALRQYASGLSQALGKEGFQ